MLKNFRLIALIFGIATSAFSVSAQNENYKDVLLNGKPAKLNLVTGEVTYLDGEIAKTRAAKRLQDSLLSTRTVIKTNLIVDMPQDSDAMKIEIAKEEMTENDKTVISSESNTDKEDIPETSTISMEPEMVEEVEKIGESQGDSIKSHTVSKGETLYSLSKRYNTTVGDILISNNLRSTVIKVGQKLQIPHPHSQESRQVTWIVSKGETLSEIARRNNTTITKIKQLNDMSNDLIKIGQRLQIQQNSETAKK